MAPELLPEPRDQEDRVVGAHAEYEHDDERIQDRRQLPAGLREEAETAPSDQECGPDRRQWDEGRQRSPVDRQQHQDHQQDRDQRRPIRPVADGLEVVATDFGLAGDLGREAGWQDARRGEMCPDRLDRRIRQGQERRSAHVDASQLDDAVGAAHHRGKGRRMLRGHVVEDAREVAAPLEEGPQPFDGRPIRVGQTTRPGEDDEPDRRRGIPGKRLGDDVARGERLGIARQEAALVGEADLGQ